MYILVRLIKILVIVVIIYVLYKALWKGEPFGFLRNKKKRRVPQTPQKAIEEMKKDPVCGTYIPVHEARTLNSGNEIQYFCSEECKEKFQKETTE